MTVPPSIIRSFFTVHCTLSANLYDIYQCCVYSEKTPDDGRRNSPKHVEFYSKNTFDKLVHLVGFIIKIVTMHGHLNVNLSPFFNIKWAIVCHRQSNVAFETFQQRFNGTVRERAQINANSYITSCYSFLVICSDSKYCGVRVVQ